MSRVFNGSNYIQAPAIGNSLDISSGPMSISFWFNPTTLGIERDIVGKWGGSFSNSQYLIGTGVSAFGASGSQIGYCVGGYASLTGVFGFVTTTISTGNWYQVVLTADTAGTYTSGAPTVTMNLAGAGTGTSFTAFRENRTAGGVNFRMAAQQAGPDYIGALSQVGVWRACLSPAEIRALQAGVAPSRIRPYSLAGYWPLYGASSPEPDFSANGNLGTLNSAPTQGAQYIGTAY